MEMEMEEIITVKNIRSYPCTVLCEGGVPVTIKSGEVHSFSSNTYYCATVERMIREKRLLEVDRQSVHSKGCRGENLYIHALEDTNPCPISVGVGTATVMFTRGDVYLIKPGYPAHQAALELVKDGDARILTREDYKELLFMKRGLYLTDNDTKVIYVTKANGYIEYEYVEIRDKQDGVMKVYDGDVRRISEGSSYFPRVMHLIDTKSLVAVSKDIYRQKQADFKRHLMQDERDNELRKFREITKASIAKSAGLPEEILFPPMEKAAKRLSEGSLYKALLDIAPEIVTAVNMYIGHESRLQPVVDDEDERERFVGCLIKRGVMKKLMAVVAAKVKGRLKIKEESEYKKSDLYNLRKEVGDFKLDDVEGKKYIIDVRSNYTTKETVNTRNDRFDDESMKRFLVNHKHERDYSHRGVTVIREYYVPNEFLVSEEDFDK